MVNWYDRIKVKERVEKVLYEGEDGGRKEDVRREAMYLKNGKVGCVDGSVSEMVMNGGEVAVTWTWRVHMTA